jgi:truncated hemoglobin YjbI
MIAIAIALFSHTQQAAATLNHNQTSIKAISKAYGFILGQEFSLERVERTYPDAAMQVELARVTFNSAFPEIKKKLEAELTAALSAPKFKEMRAGMDSKIRPMLSKQQLTPQLAQQFLEQVKARAKGEEMEPDVLHYLLAVRYAKNPVAEFGDGFRQRFRTDGTGKSQGVRLVLQLPRSWVAKDGERPHIVQKWTSEGGTGSSMIMLDIRDAQGYAPDRKEMEHFVKSGEVREIVPEGGTMHDSGTFTMEKRTGYWIDMSLELERAGFRMYERGSIHQLFINGKAVGLMCMSYSKVDKPQQADAAAKLNKPICQQVLNSLVLEQAY